MSRGRVAFELGEAHRQRFLGGQATRRIFYHNDEFLRIGEPGGDHHPAAALELV